MASDKTPTTVVADEARLLDSLNVLLQAANRQHAPGIETRAGLNHLEITLRFDNKSMSVDTLRKLAAVAAERAE
jgi:hypothetical protein